MDDLQYLKDNFSGMYISRMAENIVLHYVRQDPGYSVERRALIARGLKSFYFDIMPNSEILLVDHNKEMIHFPINTPQYGFWFHYFGGSIATYENNTLTIEMMGQSPTKRKVIYQFHESPEGRKYVELKIFDGIIWWRMIYDKVF